MEAPLRSLCNYRSNLESGFKRGSDDYRAQKTDRKEHSYAKEP